MLDLTTARILLTGAHGFLGGYVYEQLLAHGARKPYVRFIYEADVCRILSGGIERYDSESRFVVMRVNR